MGFLKDFMTRFRVPEGTNWGWYQNAEVDKLGAEVMQTFDDVEQTKILQRRQEIARGGRAHLHRTRPQSARPIAACDRLRSIAELVSRPDADRRHVAAELTAAARRARHSIQQGRISCRTSTDLSITSAWAVRAR
jgi:hypothetical protein